MATRRSTTGCTACKRKRRKCSEGKPYCKRCVASGEPCSYEYVEYVGSMPHLIRRTKPAPRRSPEPSTTNSRDPEASLGLAAAPLAAALTCDLTTDISNSKACGDYVDLDLDFSMSSGYTVNDPTLFTELLPSYFLLDGANTSKTVPALTQTSVGIPSLGSGTVRERSQLDDGESEVAGDYDCDSDSEGIRSLLCVAPTLDRNVKENSLPFVLQCYSQWAIVSVFEPLKIVHAMREQVIGQFASEDTRARAILMGNVMSMFAKNLSVDAAGMSIIAYLDAEMRENARSFMASPPSSVLALDRKRAMHTLDSTLEIMTLQVNTRSLADCIQTLEDAAPVFRRACPEPPGQPINLANILLDPALNLRHFVSIDIMLSATTGRPTCFKYQVAFSNELCDRMFQLQENYGLHWLHGLPDQFIMIFAWINSLCEVPGTSVDPHLVARIETGILEARIVLGQSEDPTLGIGRMVVRESWRNAALIYLYMVLCGADASDTRVVLALKNFMRLIRGIKPARHPDTYLANPMIIAGVAACKQQDRETIRQRILSVPECSTPGTAGYDVVRELEDVWTRTKNEARATVWSDLGISCFKITGK